MAFLSTMNEKTLRLNEIESPLGILTAGYTVNGLAMLSFSESSDSLIPKNLRDLKVQNLPSEYHEQLKEELSDYFAGNLMEFKIPLDLKGTDFQKSVWTSLLNIPYGVTRSYKEQAVLLGDVKAIRAVATANGANPVPIVVPCHRIIGSNQSLTGYVGGLHRKQFLLDLESNQGKLF